MFAMIEVFVEVPVSKLVRRESREEVRCAHVYDAAFKFCPECGISASGRAKAWTDEVPLLASCKYTSGSWSSFGHWLRSKPSEAFGSYDVLDVTRDTDDVTKVEIGLAYNTQGSINGNEAIALIDAMRTALPELSLKRSDVSIRASIRKG